MHFKLLILLQLLVFAQAGDYSTSHLVNCSQILSNSTLTSTTYNNLQYLWDKAILHDIDRYTFLIFCPIILILQSMILVIYKKYSNLMQKPRNIFFGIVMFQFLINLHYLATSIYYTIENPNDPMPESFPTFCIVNSFSAAFLEIIHIEFMLLFPLYIIYILRFTLKSNSKIWTMIYILTGLIAMGLTLILWFEDLLGLNIFGLCSISFIRMPDLSYVPPLTILAVILIFLFVGLFTTRYFKKHMPNTVGLRWKKYRENRVLFYYILGFSVYLVVNLSINILELVNCRQQNPETFIEIFITVLNILRLSQFVFIFVIIFKNQTFRSSFKKFWKSKFTKHTKQQITLQFNKTNSFYKTNQSSIDYEQFFLDIKQERNQLDLLKISQVVTIVTGIYVAYKQYYNINDDYYRPFLSDDSNKSQIRSEYSAKTKTKNARPTRKIYYHEKMSIAIDSEIIKDYVMDLNLIPRLGILACNMTIHSPKVFQMLLESDSLGCIYESFELHDNSKKMFDLVEGQGGKSGEFFFFSHDNKYVLKTITQNEFQFLEENLFYFNEHFQRNPNSLLAKVYGLFTFKGYEIQRTYHLILMKNILGCTKDQIIRTYDLKGSKYDREVNIGDTVSNELEKITLKDIDFMKMEKRLYIKNEIKADLRQIIQKDSIFLKNLNLIDYSLLIVKVRWEKQPKNPDFWGFYQRIQSSVDLETYYHIGIIDYLQKWDFQKKGEKWWKRLWGKRDISAQDPKKYQLRFMTFVNEIAQSLSLKSCQFELDDLAIEEEKESQEQQSQENQNKNEISKQHSRQELNHDKKDQQLKTHRMESYNQSQNEDTLSYYSKKKLKRDKYKEELFKTFQMVKDK